jgi:REP element-mobilizing transposase RayT
VNRLASLKAGRTRALGKSRRYESTVMDMTGTGKAVGPGATPVGNAAIPPTVSEASGQRFADVTVRHRGRLLHAGKESVTYFVPFRPVDWRPKSVLGAIESEGNAMLNTVKQMARGRSGDERKTLARLSRKTIERYLDDGAGACYLVNPALANEIAGTRKHLYHQRYSLFARCLMPNHVHLAVRLFPGRPLAVVIHSLKSCSAKRCKRVFGISGSFWQREYCDHLVRDESKFEQAIRYVGENPAKAGLRDWRWVWGQDGPIPAGGTPAPQKVPLARAGTTGS